MYTDCSIDYCPKIETRKPLSERAQSLLGKRAVWIKELIWFMDSPYGGKIYAVREDETGISVFIERDGGGLFGWSAIENFQISPN
jgi:hypothetical protein